MVPVVLKMVELFDIDRLPALLMVKGPLVRYRPLLSVSGIAIVTPRALLTVSLAMTELVMAGIAKTGSVADPPIIRLAVVLPVSVPVGLPPRSLNPFSSNKVPLAPKPNLPVWTCNEPRITAVSVLRFALKVPLSTIKFS